MANIKVTLDYQIHDGMALTFKAPCDCTAVTGLKIYYPSLAENTSTQTSKTFVFKDSHGATLTGIGNLFMANSYVKVILDTVNNFAYLQNADTNSYLENNKLAKSGGTMTGVLTAQNNTSYTTKQVRNAFLITEGSSLPSGASGDLCFVYKA